MDKTGFIHMNGRVYDPELGRFLSPDPIVQAPSNSQSWNRYTYTFNSPLSFTDPSGYSSDLPPGWDGEIHYENDIHFGEYQRADNRLIRRLFPRVWGPRECPYGFVLVKENRFKTGCKPYTGGERVGYIDYGSLGNGVIDTASLERLRSSGPGSISQTGVGVGSSADVRSEAFAAATLAQEESFDEMVHRWISEADATVHASLREFYNSVNVNPLKIAVGTGNAVRSRVQAFQGLVLSRVAVLSGALGQFEIAVPAGALAAWRYQSSVASARRGGQQLGEGFAENLSDLSVKNVLGILPFGQKIDDVGEPLPWNLEIYEDESFLDIIGEIGSGF
ncbi:RHS repeat-associated core domain-containing protein [Porticoccus sp. W117]|uniref:RHS repeat domain-containing protein n=1 Tax=Porticoccus sp. W117 TaxID=3054777 RepID=UPI002596B53B|nr:RHS repeat-associated core domain-containing protein [Porticoccus sp. W117]MDM3871858.1 RHS repeat-associated core domain-containing protein [Porticoccus sp. W117]